MPAVLPACAAILCPTKAWAATENLSIKLEYRIARGLKPIRQKGVSHLASDIREHTTFPKT